MLGEAVELLRILGRPGWTPERMVRYRLDKLHRLLRHAYDKVPYYRDLMKRIGAGPEDIRSFDDLTKFPVTTKAMLRDAGSDAVAEGATNLLTQHTSGHSGTPFAVHCTAKERRTRRLREFRMLLAAGRLGPRDRLVLLGPTVNRPQRLHRLLGFYPLEVIPCTLPPAELSQRLLATHPEVLWVYPTSLKTVLYHTGMRLSEICRPRTLITSSQAMDLPFRERLLSEIPGMEIVDIYGASEVGRIASVCELRNGLHLEEDSLHVELLDAGRPVTPGEYGEITLTSLDQFAMPFIRYDLGDLCRLRLDDCPCGRSTRRIDPPIGRNADMITLPDGKKASCALLDVALRGLSGLVQYRFVQTSLTRIRAELFFDASPGGERLEELRMHISALLANAFEITIVQMPCYRTDGQKFKVFVSELEGEPQ